MTTSIKSSTEQRILAQIKRGDRSALGELLRNYQHRIYNICLRMLSNRDDAAEITQETLLKIIQKIDDFRGESELSTWIIRIAMNQSISHLRKRKLRLTTSIDSSRSGEHDHEDQASSLRNRLADSQEPQPFESVEKKEMLDHLKVALASLEEPFRAVLVLRDIDQIEYEQIAEVLDVPVGTVKSRLFRARLALRQEMRRLYSTGEEDKVSTGSTQDDIDHG